MDVDICEFWSQYAWGYQGMNACVSLSMVFVIQLRTKYTLGIIIIDNVLLQQLPHLFG